MVSIAVGSLVFVEKIKSELGIKVLQRNVIEANRDYALREPSEAYGVEFAARNAAVTSQNTFLWDERFDEAKA